MGDNDTIGNTLGDALLSGPIGILGNALNQLFGQDYQDYYDLGATHPETGENLFVAEHVNGNGATLISENDLPTELSDVQPWESYVEAAGETINPQIQNAAGDIMSAYAQLVGENPELTNIIAGIDLMDSNYIDVFHIDHAAETIGRIAAEKGFMASDTEASGVYSGIANDMSALRETLNGIVEGAEYSTLVTVDRGMQDLGFDAAEIEAVMTIPENVNAPAPGVAPQPDILQQP